MDWTISHFWLHFHTKNKVVGSDAEPKRCDIRGLPHPRSFLVFPPANDRPRAARARRSVLIAFGPMPWSCLSSVSLTLVNCSSRRSPAPTSARCAGAASSLGRSLSCGVILFFLPHYELRQHE